MTTPTTPVTIDLGDGKARELRYTVATAKRFAEKYGDQFLQKPAAIILPELIYEGLKEKDGLTADSIADMIPFHELQRYLLITVAAMNGKTVEQLEAEAKQAEAEKNGASSQTVQ
jgi:hypothetical protein